MGSFSYLKNAICEDIRWLPPPVTDQNPQMYWMTSHWEDLRALRSNCIKDVVLGLQFVHGEQILIYLETWPRSLVERSKHREKVSKIVSKEIKILFTTEVKVLKIHKHLSVYFKHQNLYLRLCVGVRSTYPTHNHASYMDVAARQWEILLAKHQFAGIARTLTFKMLQVNIQITMITKTYGATFFNVEWLIEVLI